MIYQGAKEFVNSLEKGKRVLALDISKNNIGLAVSDREFNLASPLKTIKRSKFSFDVENLKKTIDDNNIGGLVIGLPISMDGTEGKNCQSIRQFARNVLKEFDIAIYFVDERLTSFAASEIIDESRFTREKKKSLNDKVAASLILEEFLRLI